jgi:DNA-binding XRE family transcriptional regulator
VNDFSFQGMKCHDVIPMADTDLNLVLALLRVIRGWNQDQLARAAGMRNSAISDYERGRRTPELRTLEKLVGAMGYPLSAVDQTRSFIHALRANALLADGAGKRGAPGPSSGLGPAVGADDDGSRRPAVAAGLSFESSAALQWEIDQVSSEAGRVAARMAQLFLLLLHRAGGAPDEHRAGGSPREHRPDAASGEPG